MRTPNRSTLMPRIARAAPIRTLVHPSRACVHAVCVSGEGEVLIYAAGERSAHAFSLNGASLGGISYWFTGLRISC